MAHPDLSAFEWRPRVELAKALHALGVAAGWRTGAGREAVDVGTVRATNHDSQDHHRTEGVTDLARAAGLDADLVDVPASRPLVTLRRMSPLVLDVPGSAGVLVVLRCGRRSATLVGPGGVGQVPLAVVENLLWRRVDSAADASGSSLRSALDGILPGQSVAAHRVLVAPGLAGRPLAGAWTIRRISTSLVDDLRRAGLLRRFALVIAAFVAQFALFFAIWSLVGARVLTTIPNDRVRGWQSWGAVLALLGAWVVAQLLASVTVSRLALDVGALVRVWLLRGALRIDGERIRSAGVGQLLGRALDAEALDVLALGGGVQAVAGIFELGLGVVVLALGAAPGWCFAALVLTLAGVVIGARVHERHLVRWCRTRRELTHDLVERMVGHRTVLIQDRPLHRQAADDAALTAYDTETRDLDRAAVWLGIGLPRAWLLLGLLTLAPIGAFPFGAFGRGAPGPAIAMSVGGIWLLYAALRRLGIALPTLSSAREAWGRIVPMIGVGTAAAADAAELPIPNPAPAPAPAPDAGVPDQPDRGALVSAHGLTYQYPGRTTPVLQGVDLQIAPGDRVLIEGASGGGKSTLAALLTGLKVPATGRLTLRGVDQRFIGLAGWRRAVGAAPQFHDNHVLGADLLFNLLMGRRWPPRVEDEVAADRVCRELGLGPLLDRMPAGLQQQVGETGWQLSHGERSRLFVARSLLQTLDLRVLDESFAALDPETLDQVMETVLRQPEALVVIAHP